MVCKTQLVLLGVLMSGCVPAVSPPLASDHPANPLAAEAPLPSPSQTLAHDPSAAGTPLDSPAQQSRPTRHGHHHGGAHE